MSVPVVVGYPNAVVNELSLTIFLLILKHFVEPIGVLFGDHVLFSLADRQNSTYQLINGPEFLVLKFAHNTHKHNPSILVHVIYIY